VASAGRWRSNQMRAAPCDLALADSRRGRAAGRVAAETEKAGFDESQRAPREFTRHSQLEAFDAKTACRPAHGGLRVQHLINQCRRRPARPFTEIDKAPADGYGLITFNFWGVVLSTRVPGRFRKRPEAISSISPSIFGIIAPARAIGLCGDAKFAGARLLGKPAA